MVLKEDVIFKFGKHSGKTIEFLIQTEPDYIDWVIGNFEYIEIHPFFLQNAIKLNPNFKISEMNLEKFKIRVSNFLQDYSSNDYNKLKAHFESNNFLKVPFLTNVEKESARLKIRNLHLQLLQEAKAKRINEAIEIKRIQDEFESQKMVDDFWNDLENSTSSDVSEDGINWEKYDENLGYGEQSEDFWN